MIRFILKWVRLRRFREHKLNKYREILNLNLIDYWREEDGKLRKIFFEAIKQKLELKRMKRLYPEFQCAVEELIQKLDEIAERAKNRIKIR